MKPHMLYPDQDLLVQKNLKDHQEALIKDLDWKPIWRLWPRTIWTGGTQPGGCC